jgi:hypothetical protein
VTCPLAWLFGWTGFARANSPSWWFQRRIQRCFSDDDTLLKNIIRSVSSLPDRKKSAVAATKIADFQCSLSSLEFRYKVL